MNKRFIIGFVLAAILIMLISFGIKNFVNKRSTRFRAKVNLENTEILEESLLNAAESYSSKNDYMNAKIYLEKFTNKFPDSKKYKKAQNDIEELNIKILFSDVQNDDSFAYEIKKGDALAKIARKFNTTVELLKKSNDLKKDVIYPGKFLKVNKTKFNVLVNKTDNKLYLKRPDGGVVKTYIVATGKNLCTPVGAFKIEEKMIAPRWYKVGAVVEPDSPEYELGSRWMGLSIEGYGIHGTKDASSIGQYVTKGCVRMANKDVEELYAILPSGTEVVIVE